MAVGKETISSAAESFHENPFNSQQFNLRHIRIIRGGRAIVSLDITSPCRFYVTTRKAMQFDEGFLAILWKTFRVTIILLFLT